MGNMHISLFGKLRVCSSDAITIKVEPRRAEELLCYLLLYRHRLHEREKLATLLWPDASPVQSRRYLRQTLWQLQSILNQALQPKLHLLHIEHTRLGINLQTTDWLDIAIFEQAFAAVADRHGRDLCADQAEQLRQATQLYQGDLLEGWYQDWCILERDRLQNMYLAMLDKLVAYSEANQTYEASLGYGIQILRYDRAREQTHRQLMRLYHLAGNRTAALHQFNACVTALREELDVEPALSTIALYQQILNEQCTAAAPGALESARRALAPPPLPDALQQLEQIQSSLSQLQAQVSYLLQMLKQNALHPS